MRPPVNHPADSDEPPLRMPKFLDAPAAAALPALTNAAASEGGGGSASGDRVASFADKFGEVGIELPLRVAPIEIPADIDDKLTFGSSAGDRLINESILFHWEGDGWAVGTIKSRNLKPGAHAQNQKHDQGAGQLQRALSGRRCGGGARAVEARLRDDCESPDWLVVSSRA